MAYDEKCEDLALHFLPSNASYDLIVALAQHIQDEVESWLQSEIDRRTPPTTAEH